MNVGDYIDKDELARRLSLEFVCAQYGILLNRDGAAKCIFHDDHRPSFHLFDGDDGKRRWWCYPCGGGGDVFDLIRKKEGVDFPTALERAREMLGIKPEEWESPVAEDTAPRQGPADWAGDLEDAQRRATEDPTEVAIELDLTPHPLLSGDHETPRKAGRWVTSTFGLGLHPSGGIVFPHYNSQGQLTGIKIRRTHGERAAFAGSKFPELYGAWRPRRFKASILTEGETDHIWTALELARRKLQVDVFSLPRGAGAPPTVEQGAAIQGSDIIFLAFDADDSGRKATVAWLEFLRSSGFTDVRFCRLPFHQDLRGARPNLDRLLRSAQRVESTPTHIQRQPAGYFKALPKGGDLQLTTWSLEVTAKLVSDDEDVPPGFLTTLHDRGATKEETILVTDLESKSKLIRWAGQRDLGWLGSDHDVRQLQDLLHAESTIVPQVFQAPRAGLQPPPPGYVLDDYAVALPGPSIGRVPWRYVPVIGATDVHEEVLIGADWKTFDWQWITDFLELNERGVTEPLLAWVVAAMRRPEVKTFPMIFLAGSSGSGKTTIAELACRLGGSSIFRNLAGMTSFTLYSALASTTSLPVFVDEWTRQTRPDVLDALQGVIPAIYNGGYALRGRQDLGDTRFRMAAPVIIAGENTFNLERAVERMIALPVSRPQQNPEALARLEGQPLEGFARTIYHWLTADRRNMLTPPPPFIPTGSTRPEYNMSCLREGWRTLIAFMEWLENDHHQPTPNFPAEPDFTRVNEVAAELAGQSPYWDAILEASGQTDASNLPLVWYDPEQSGTWVRVAAVVAHADRLKIELPGGAAAFNSWLRERVPGSHAARPRVPITGQQVSATFVPGLNLEE